MPPPPRARLRPPLKRVNDLQCQSKITGRNLSYRPSSVTATTCGTHGTTDPVERPGHSKKPGPPAGSAAGEWGLGKIIVSWELCDCPPALAAQTAGPAGHVAVCCAVKGCRSVWYRPRHERG